MSLLVGIVVVWLAAWFVAWRIFYGPMAGKQINYVDRYPWTSFYFLVMSAFIVFAFRDMFRSVAGTVAIVPFAVLIATIVLQILVYRLGVKYLRRPGRLIEESPREMFLRLDYRYLVSKSFEVLFQQVMIVLLVVMVWRQIGNLAGTVAVFAAVFAFAHVPLLKVYGVQTGLFAKIYLIASLVSAVIFPAIILEVNLGFIYTYAMHSMFFTVLALWFWRRS